MLRKLRHWTVWSVLNVTKSDGQSVFAHDACFPSCFIFLHSNVLLMQKCKHWSSDIESRYRQCHDQNTHCSVTGSHKNSVCFWCLFSPRLSAFYDSNARVQIPRGMSLTWWPGREMSVLRNFTFGKVDVQPQWAQKSTIHNLIGFLTSQLITCHTLLQLDCTHQILAILFTKLLINLRGSPPHRHMQCRLILAYSCQNGVREERRTNLVC